MAFNKLVLLCFFLQDKSGTALNEVCLIVLFVCFFLSDECDLNLSCHAVVYCSPSPLGGGGSGDSEPPAGRVGAAQGR